MLIELRVGIVHPSAGQIQPDLVVFAVNPRKPVGSFDYVEFAVDVNLFELVDQNDRGIPKWRGIPNGYLDRQPFVGAIASLFHDLVSRRSEEHTSELQSP